MAQKIVTVCDAHADSVDEHPGEALGPISLDGGRTYYATDLCEPAYKDLIAPLAEFLAAHARSLKGEEVAALRQRAGKPGPKAPPSPLQTTKWPCPLCHRGPMVRSSLRTHMPSHHGKSLPQVEAELGETLDGRKVNLYCNECGGGFNDERGLSVHGRAGCPDTELAATPTLLDPPPKKATKKATKRKKAT